jgi:hypothetical protein
MRRVFFRTLIIVATSTSLCLAALHSQLASAETASESQVKAAFLYRFTNYVQWPPSAAPAANLTIAILGDDAVAAELLKLVQTKKSQGTEVRVQLIASVTDDLSAHVLYVSAGYRGDLRTALQALAQKPVLTVTDAPNALELGAILNFVTADRRVRFEVSVASAQRAGIYVSSELLSVAARVIGAHARADGFCGFITLDQNLLGCPDRVAGT